MLVTVTDQQRLLVLRQNEMDEEFIKTISDVCWSSVIGSCLGDTVVFVFGMHPPLVQKKDHFRELF